MIKASAIAVLLILSACDAQQMREAQRALASGSSSVATPTPTPSCADFSEYNSYLECQTTTKANCNSDWRTFSGGGVGVCYFPVAGWEACSTATTGWIYTTYTATVCYSASLTSYIKARSVLGCSSNICACMTPPVQTAVCTLGVDCPDPTPSPMPSCP